MIKYNLQMFGGNGANGTSLSGGGGANVNIKNEEDVWSYRHNPNNQDFVDDINVSVARIQEDFSDVMSTVYSVNATEFGGSDAYNTLGCWGSGTLSMNRNFTNVEKMNKVYDDSVKSGFHPSRGNRTGVEAVTLHEMGHAVTDNLVGKVPGTKNLDDVAKVVVKAAYKASGAKGGNKGFAAKISGYATHNYAECVAEAVADVYCNGSKAHANSKLIVAELKKYK